MKVKRIAGFRLMVEIMLTIFIVSVAAGPFFPVRAEGTGMGDGTVRRIDVNLLVSPGDIYQPLQKRIKSAIEGALEKLYLGRESGQLLEMGDGLESSTRDIVEKLLPGFELRDLETTVDGDTLKFYIFIVPSSPLIHTVKVDISIETENKELSKLVANMGQELEKNLTGLFTGIPVDTFKWAEAFLKPALGLVLLNQFPGFDYDYDLSIDRITSLKVRLIPEGERVERIKATIMSDSIPRLLLRNIEADFNEQAAILEGLPVDFVRKHSGRLGRIIDDKITNGLEDTAFAVSSETEIRPGRETLLNIRLSLNNYRIKLSGNINMEMSGISPGMNLYLSRVFNQYGGLELFARLGAGLKREDLLASAGFGYPIFDHLYLEAEYGLYPDRNNISLILSPTRNIDLKVTQSMPTGKKIVDISYSLTNYHSVYFRYDTVKSFSAGVTIDF